MRSSPDDILLMIYFLRRNPSINAYRDCCDRSAYSGRIWPSQKSSLNYIRAMHLPSALSVKDFHAIHALEFDEFGNRVRSSDIGAGGTLAYEFLIINFPGYPTISSSIASLSNRPNILKDSPNISLTCVNFSKCKHRRQTWKANIEREAILQHKNPGQNNINPKSQRSQGSSWEPLSDNRVLWCILLMVRIFIRERKILTKE